MALRPCLGLPGHPCSRLVDGRRRCDSCNLLYNRPLNKAKDARRGSAHQRGLGVEHRRQVEALLAAYIAQHGHPPTHCPSCARAITARNPITGEHTQPRAHGGRVADMLLCKSCNSRRGATVRRHAE